MYSVVNPSMNVEDNNETATNIGKIVLLLATFLVGGGGGVALGTSYGGGSVVRDPGLERRLTLIETHLDSLSATSNKLEAKFDALAEHIQTNSQKKGR